MPNRKGVLSRLSFSALTFGVISHCGLAYGYDASSKWASLADMQTGRSEISAAQIESHIYVAGGIGFMRTLDSCERYDIVSNTWSTCPNLPYPLHHVALASNGSNVFAAGGYINLGFTHDPKPRLWRLDEIVERWVEVAALPTQLGEHSMFSHGGDLYLVGGRTSKGDSNALWKYNETRKQWKQLANMPTPRHSFSIVIVDDELWVMGGRSAALGRAIDRTEKYNFAEDHWINGPTLPEGRGGHASVVNGNLVHVIGGELFDPARIIDRHDVYDLETQRWFSLESPPLPRHGMVAVSLQDKFLLLGGGARPARMTVFSASSSVQAFHFTEDTK